MSQAIKRERGGLYLHSNLWLDSPTASNQIVEKVASGSIDAKTAELLEHFVENGYLIIQLPDDELANIDLLVEDVNQLWQELPSEVAFAYDSPAMRMSCACAASQRKPRYRIHDMHSYSRAALALYLSPSVFRIMELIYNEPPVAIQTLYFEYGSQQVLHRDPVVVPTAPASHLLAAWIALEDIQVGSGELQFVPGSHRLPYYEVEPGQYRFDPTRMGAAEVEKAMEWDRQQCQKAGLEAKHFRAKKGEILIWHHSLLHGGSPCEEEFLTRESFVVHFSTRRNYQERGITLLETNEGKETFVPYKTKRLIEKDGRVGFANPINPNT